MDGPTVNMPEHVEDQDGMTLYPEFARGG